MYSEDASFGRPKLLPLKYIQDSLTVREVKVSLWELGLFPNTVVLSPVCPPELPEEP